MLLNLSSLKDNPGGTIPFEVVLDLHELVFGGCRPATEPVTASGEVRNTAGVYVLSGELRTTLHGPCDRCAKDVDKPVSFPLHAILAEELTSGDGEEDPCDLETLVNELRLKEIDAEANSELVERIRKIRREKDRGKGRRSPSAK